MKKTVLQNTAILVLALAITAALCGCSEFFDDHHKKDNSSHNNWYDDPEEYPPYEEPINNDPEDYDPYAPPPAPFNLRADYTITWSRIAWDEKDRDADGRWVPRADGFILYHSDSPQGEYEEIRRDSRSEYFYSSVTHKWESYYFHVIEGLPKKEPHYYKVRAYKTYYTGEEYDENGQLNMIPLVVESELSDYITVTQADLRYPPREITVRRSVLNNGDDAYIQWTRVTGVEEYNIYRDTELVATTPGQGASGTYLSFTDIEPPFGYTYEYTVASVTADGAGPKSQGVSFQTRPSPPDSPILLSGTDPDTGSPYIYIDVYGGGLGANKFTSYRSTKEEGPYEMAIPLGRNNRDSHVIPGVRMYYKVSGINEVGESEMSPAASIIVKASSSTPSKPSDPVVITQEKAPSAPTGVKVEAANVLLVRNMRLTWDKVSGADGYKVYRDGVMVYNTHSGNITFYLDLLVTLLTNYTYSVTAYNSGGESGYSRSVSTGTYP